MSTSKSKSKNIRVSEAVLASRRRQVLYSNMSLITLTLSCFFFFFFFCRAIEQTQALLNIEFVNTNFADLRLHHAFPARLIGLSNVDERSQSVGLEVEVNLIWYDNSAANELIVHSVSTNDNSFILRT